MTAEQQKQQVALKALEYIKEGMVVGLGTGSTAKFFIEGLGTKVAEGFQIKTICTSEESENLAKQLNIPLTDFTEVEVIDITIDGADEVDKQFNLIKGGGGALLREKIIASSSKQEIIIVDEKKVVEKLGKFHLPVEIIPYVWQTTQRKIEALQGITMIRQRDGGIFVTDNGNYILDCNFGSIDNPQLLERNLNMIPGVVENGLFVNIATTVIVGSDEGARELEKQ